MTWGRPVWEGWGLIIIQQAHKFQTLSHGGKSHGFPAVPSFSVTFILTYLSNFFFYSANILPWASINAFHLVYVTDDPGWDKSISGLREWSRYGCMTQ